MISAARSGIARRHVARSVRGVDAFGRFSSLCAFGRQLAPLASAGGAFSLAYPRRGGVVPGAAMVSAAALGCDRRHSVAVAGAGAVDSLHRHPRRYGGPHWPASVCMSRLRFVAEAENDGCEIGQTARILPTDGRKKDLTP